MVRMAEERDRQGLRVTFDTVAEQYEEARPTYPDALLDDLVAETRLPAGGRIAEIGPGTGKASVALSAGGFELVGVELGRGLAAVARRQLAPYPNASIVVGAFERWQPEEADFDAVVAFTSFHWVDPDVRYVKSAELLRPGGALAAVSTRHVLPPGGDPVWTELRAAYDAVRPDPDNGPPPAPEDVPDLREEMEATGLFESVVVQRHLWQVDYTADEYIAVLGTYSANIALPAAQRTELFARIHASIAERGTVRKTYLGTLNVARKR
jgi:SAM-dependent methyltransferase